MRAYGFSKYALVLLALSLSGMTAVAETPDGQTPANEGVCDELMGATPGLYGLCVAFCEAQDCEPDFALENPFENCSPSSDKLLEIYDRKKQDGDIDMPCIKAPCPCWSPEELVGYSIGPAPDDDQTNPDRCSNGDLVSWAIFSDGSNGTENRNTSLAVEIRTASVKCSFRDNNKDTGVLVSGSQDITEEAGAIAACTADVISSREVRGFDNADCIDITFP